MAICKMMITLSKAYITQNAHKQPKSITDVQTTGCILMHSNEVPSRNALQRTFLEKQPNKSYKSMFKTDNEATDWITELNIYIQYLSTTLTFQLLFFMALH